MEKIPNDDLSKEANKQEQEQILINFFEKKGYRNLKRLEKSVNYYFTGEINGVECFIKKFNRPHIVNINTNKERTKTEIDCYQNLPSDLLIEYIEGNENECYIVLKKEILEDFGRDKGSVKQMMDLCLRLSQVDAKFLPEMSSNYDGIFKKLELLDSANIVNDAGSIKKQFIDNQELIKNSPKVFSHLDFNFLNVKKLGNRAVIFDFENAKQDNAMVDMAVLYIEISDDQELVNEFEENIKKHPLYNEELLRLMVLRRCIILTSACIDLLSKPNVEKNIKILNELASKKHIFDNKDDTKK